MKRNLDYDIINCLAAKSHLQWRYEQYIKDAVEAGDEQARQVFEQIKDQDVQAIEALKELLKRHVQEGSFD